MQERLLTTIMRGGLFVLVSSVLFTLIITTILFFELAGAGTINKLLYGAFIAIAFITSIICARSIRAKGWLAGASVAGVFIVFGLLYRLIGVEAGLGLGFLTRAGITLAVCLIGGMLGVNTVKS